MSHDINPACEFEAFIPDDLDGHLLVEGVEAYARSVAETQDSPSLLRRIGSSVLGYVLEGAPHVAASFGYMVPTYLQAQRRKRSN